MKKNISSKIALCIAAVFCMSLFAGIPAFADNKALVKVSVDKQKNYLEDAVLKLVQEGSLTKEKAEKILEYKKKRTEELERLKKEHKKGSLLNELKENGIITETEALTIKAKLREMKDERLNGGLQDLVDKGVLSAADIDNMRSYMLKVREERKERIEKLKSMTPEKRKAYFRENKEFRKDILTRMVEDKVITVKQAEEIRKAIPELGKTRHKLH